MSGFRYAAPELEHGETVYDKMRRHELHRLAIEKGLLSSKQGTPTKNTLVAMLKAGIDLSNKNDILAEMEKPEAIPLNIAHKERVETQQDLRLQIEALQARLAEKEGSNEETPQRKLTAFKHLKHFQKKKVLKDEFGAELPRTAKGPAFDALYAEKLGIEPT